MEKNKIFRRTQQVRSYDVDQNLELKLNVIFQWFSEIAWEHAKILGLGFEELNDIDKFWVLNSVNIEINKLAKWQDEIILETWPSGISGLQFTREFKIYDKNEKLLLAASSSWVIIDKNSLAPILPEEFSFLNEISKEKATENLLKKIPRHKNLNFVKTKTAQHTDIDMHKHVNNAVYVKWIENIIGNISPNKIKRFKIHFSGGLNLDEKISIFTKIEKDYIYWESLKSDDKICFRAEAEFVNNLEIT
ncbi:MAG: thioesterase [Bacteroidales bacterium]|nr:thioesterase [Bacteroidales bacterium]